MVFLNGLLSCKNKLSRTGQKFFSFVPYATYMFCHNTNELIDEIFSRYLWPGPKKFRFRISWPWRILEKSLDEFTHLRGVDHRWGTSVAYGTVFLTTISDDYVTKKDMKNLERAQHSATTFICPAKYTYNLTIFGKKMLSYLYYNIDKSWNQVVYETIYADQLLKKYILPFLSKI